MIGKAIRTPGSNASAIGQSGVVTVLAPTAMPLEQIQFELPEHEPAGRMPALLEDQFELSEDGSPSASWIEPESQAPIFFDKDDNTEPVTMADEGSHCETRPAYAELSDAPTDQSPWYTAAQLAGGNADNPDWDHNESDVSNSGDEFEVRNELELHSAPGEMTALAVIGGEASADPWDDPLPAWDYSRNEWPVLLGPDQQNSETNHRTIFAVLALVVIAALIYFLIFRPGSPEQSATAATNSSAQESADSSEPRASAAEPEADEPRASAAEPAAAGTQNEEASSGSQDSKAEQTAATTATPSNGSDNTYGAEVSNGRFSLQAAAFPTEEGANQFAEKLKRAGVPSYIIAADIARRGRWFRVRVGRFNSAADAGLFAAEAQRRAGAVGLSLQLMTCQYEQP